MSAFYFLQACQFSLQSGVLTLDNSILPGAFGSNSYHIPSSSGGLPDTFFHPPPEQNWASYGTPAWSLGMAEAQGHRNGGLQASLENLHRSLASIPSNGSRAANWGQSLDARKAPNGWGSIGEDRGTRVGEGNAPLARVPSYRDVSRDGLKKEGDAEREREPEKGKIESPKKSGSPAPKVEGGDAQIAQEAEQKGGDEGSHAEGSPERAAANTVDFSSSFPSLFSGKCEVPFDSFRPGVRLWYRRSPLCASISGESAVDSRKSRCFLAS
jgi:hypothetical protein